MIFMNLSGFLFKHIRLVLEGGLTNLWYDMTTQGPTLGLVLVIYLQVEAIQKVGGVFMEHRIIQCVYE
jgi:hypothetical protein